MPQFGDVYEWPGPHKVRVMVISLNNNQVGVIEEMYWTWRVIHLIDGISGMPEHSFGATTDYQLLNPGGKWVILDD